MLLVKPAVLFVAGKVFYGIPASLDHPCVVLVCFFALRVFKMRIAEAVQNVLTEPTLADV